MIPIDWTTIGADKLFEHIASVLPSSMFKSDGVSGWQGEIDPKTGEHFSSWGHTGGRSSTGGKYPAVTKVRSSLLKTFAGAKLTAAEFENSPRRYMWALYDGEDAYVPGNIVDLLHDDAHPGQIALRIKSHGDSPDTLSDEKIFWIDPAHNDRPVQFIDTRYRDPSLPTILSRSITDFADYESTADGHSYPTTWNQQALTPGPDGLLHPTAYHTTATLHFFPDKRLPPLPQPPGSIP